MAFFPRQFYNSDASFTPLFRLLDDFDSYSRQATRKACTPHWQPRFDVRETEQTYELHGEIPGVNKEDVHIEFTDPQTVVIRGKTERTYTSVTPPAALVEDTPISDAPVEESEAPSSPHQATVEEEFESVSHEMGEDNVDQEDTQTETKQAEEQKPTEEKPAQEKPVDKAKYWLTERSVGEFSRSFNFPSRVDQEFVSASFKDGILSIVVPKAKKHESRRINVN